MSNNSDLHFSSTNSISSSSIIQKKRPKTVSKSALIHIQNLHIPLISTATGSPLDSLSLQPDRVYTIGRTGHSCDFVFNSRFVSKQHCQIVFDSFNRKVYVIDGRVLDSDVDGIRRKGSDLISSGKLLEDEIVKGEGCSRSRVRFSLNGVFVNGVRVEKGSFKELNAGDEVLFVSGDGGDVCRVGVRIGFVVLGVVFKEEVVFEKNEFLLERPQFLGRMEMEMGMGIGSLGQSQGSVSSGKRRKRVFALESNDLWRLKCGEVIGRAVFLSGMCRNILRSDDPIGYIRQSAILGCEKENSFLWSDKLKPSDGGDLMVKAAEPISQKETMPCDTRTGLILSGSSKFQSEKAVASEEGCEEMDPYSQLRHEDSIKTSSENSVPGDNMGDKNASLFYGRGKHCGYSCSPPGKKFYLNRLEVMDCSSTDDTCVTLPELFHPVDSILQIFIATFTSDVLWYSCIHLSVILSCFVYFSLSIA